MTLTQPAANSWTHHTAHINGLRLHYVEAGSGPLVLLLHGFPEFWYSWHHQIPFLAAAGFHVVAPDQRGYNLSDKPPGVNAYRIEALTADVYALIRHFGERSAILVGHDWGGAIAWTVPLHYPDAVRKVVILNAPHPALLLRELRRPAQLLRSWYMFFFQLPALPEWAIRQGNFAGLVRTLRHEPVRRGAFSPQDVALYREALAQPGALTAAINYYRAAFRRSPARVQRGLRPLQVPTLVIWGERDRYLGLGLLEGLEEWAPGVRVARLPEASHWVQNDAPEQVNTLLREFLN